MKIIYSRICRRRRVLQLGKIVLWGVLVLLMATLITPVRNVVGYFFLPGAWRALSSPQIIGLYFADPEVPVEMTDVTCESATEKLSQVAWETYISEMPGYRVYDDEYFEEISADIDKYGTSRQDLDYLSTRYEHFKPSMTGQWQREMLLTYKVFNRAMSLFDVSYFLCEGSMLGAYRHHGFIPWDDDMDVCMNVSDWLKVKQILHCIPHFDVHTDNNMMFKFFWEGSPLWKGEDFIRFPFIDIFFFNEDSHYLWAMTHFKKNRIVFRKSDVFPLTRRPYEGLLAPVPARLDEICRTVYSPDECVSRDFDHMNRHFLPFYRVDYIPCRVLSRVYPFVVRRDAVVDGRPAVMEYRMIGRLITNNFTVFK